MASIRQPERVKLIVALLWRRAAARDEAVRRLRQLWGEIDFNGPDRPFGVTSFYDAEMGARLSRRIVSFERVVLPDMLPSAKLSANQLEKEMAVDGRRTVNLDLGYLDHAKLVLASAKEAGQKIYLGDGIYADLVGRYGDGRYRPFEWTFPDFRDGRYDEELGEIRALYMKQRRGLKTPRSVPEP